MEKQIKKTACKNHLQVFLSGTLLSLSILLSGSLMAQHSLNSSGGNCSGTNGEVSYSIGQLACINSTGANGSVSQGVQSAYIIEGASSLVENEFFSVEFGLFPNPTTDRIHLKIDNADANQLETLEYQLFNLNGELLQTGQLSSQEQSVDLSREVSGTYLFKLVNNSQAIRTYKIIKN